MCVFLCLFLDLLYVQFSFIQLIQFGSFGVHSFELSLPQQWIQLSLFLQTLDTWPSPWYLKQREIKAYASLLLLCFLFYLLRFSGVSSILYFSGASGAPNTKTGNIFGVFSVMFIIWLNFSLVCKIFHICACSFLLLQVIKNFRVLVGIQSAAGNCLWSTSLFKTVLNSWTWIHSVFVLNIRVCNCW